MMQKFEFICCNTIERDGINVGGWMEEDDGLDETKG